MPRRARPLSLQSPKLPYGPAVAQASSHSPTTFIGQSSSESPHTRSSLVLPGDRQRKRGWPGMNTFPKYVASRSVNLCSSLASGRSAELSPRSEIMRLTPAASIRASTQADTQRWHSPSQEPWSRPHSGARPSEPGNVYFRPSMRIMMRWSSSSAHDATYLRNSRASGSRSALAVSAFADSAFADSAFADSAFADSAFADSAFADSAFADSAFSSVTADWISCRSPSPQPTAPTAAVIASPRSQTTNRSGARHDRGIGASIRVL